MPFGRFGKQTVVMLALPLALATGPLWAEASAANAEPPYLGSAERALRSGAPDEALHILAAHPPVTLAERFQAEHFGLACRASLEGGDPAGAMPNCEKAIAAGASRERWRDYNNLGVAAFRLGDDAAAREAFEAAAVLSRVTFTPRKNLSTLDEGRRAGVPREQLGAALVTR